MKRCLPIALALLLMPGLAGAADRNILELQHETERLQNQASALQNSFDEDMAALRVLVKEIAASADRLNAAVRATGNHIDEQLGQTGEALALRSSALSDQLDRLHSGTQADSEAVAGLAARSATLQRQCAAMIAALENPQSAGAGSSTVSAQVLYQDALRDETGGRYELAAQEFSDYLKHFGASDLAPEAQFEIGQIAANRGTLRDAVQDFGLVLQNYPESDRAPDALYMKGVMLDKLGEHAEAAAAFAEVKRRFPGTNAARDANSRLSPGVGRTITE